MASGSDIEEQAPPSEEMAHIKNISGHSHNEDEDVELAKMGAIVVDSNMANGTARAEGMQRVWGSHGRLIVWIGMAMMLIV